jgi:Holliday junction resolvase RusA-like endonuclease
MSQSRNRHLGRVTIHFEHYYVGRPISDPDNLVSTMKIPLDALKNAKFITDDKLSVIGMPTFEQVRVTVKNQVRTVITITDL